MYVCSFAWVVAQVVEAHRQHSRPSVVLLLRHELMSHLMFFSLAPTSLAVLAGASPLQSIGSWLVVWRCQPGAAFLPKFRPRSVSIDPRLSSGSFYRCRSACVLFSEGGAGDSIGGAHQFCCRVWRVAFVLLLTSIGRHRFSPERYCDTRNTQKQFETNRSSSSLMKAGVTVDKNVRV